MNEKTLFRVLNNFNIKNCMGNCGRLNASQRRAILLELQRRGLLNSECVITEQGKEFVMDKISAHWNN